MFLRYYIHTVVFIRLHLWSHSIVLSVARRRVQGYNTRFTILGKSEKNDLVFLRQCFSEIAFHFLILSYLLIFLSYIYIYALLIFILYCIPSPAKTLMSWKELISYMFLVWIFHLSRLYCTLIITSVMLGVAFVCLHTPLFRRFNLFRKWIFYIS